MPWTTWLVSVVTSAAMIAEPTTMIAYGNI